MDALDKIEFEYYPVYDNDVTPFVKKFYAFKTIYSSMINAFEDEEVITMISESLRTFFDKFEKYVSQAGKMSNENSFKQYGYYNN
jgi:hypothetical protein